MAPQKLFECVFVRVLVYSQSKLLSHEQRTDAIRNLSASGENFKLHHLLITNQRRARGSNLKY